MRIVDYFDRTRVINLPSRADRRREITAEFARVGMAFQPGKVELFEAIRPDNDGGLPSVGYHGCYLSHLEILREARDAGLQRVLIIEDDLQVSRDFRSHEDAIVSQLQERPWDLLYLGHPIELPPPAATTLVTYDEPILMTHFYGVNGRAIGRLIDFLELLRSRSPGHPMGGIMSYDGALSTFRAQNPDVVTLLANPNLGTQRSSRTDIHPLKWFDRAPAIRDLVALARRGKQIISRS